MDVIRLEHPRPGVALVTIDRPDRRNALRREDITALTGVLADVATDDSVLAVVLTGNGAFCAGADLRGLQRVVGEGPVGPALYEPAHALVRQLLAVPVPTIAAIDGPAIGMGADLALACDCRVLGSDGWLRQGWAARGAIPATGGLVFLRHLAPGAIWTLLDGQPRVDGPLAERLGIGEAAPGGSARERALDRARAYTEIPAAALRAYVRLTREPVVRDLEAEFPELAAIQADLFNRPSFAERVGHTLTPEGRRE